MRRSRSKLCKFHGNFDPKQRSSCNAKCCEDPESPLTPENDSYLPEQFGLLRFEPMVVGGDIEAEDAQDDDIGDGDQEKHDTRGQKVLVAPQDDPTGVQGQICDENGSICEVRHLGI